MSQEASAEADRGARAEGRRRREEILATAARLATVEGLDGLSIGRLAAATRMSKSGLYAHFGSKQELQLATIDTARDVFIDVVVSPAMDAPRGRQRLRALCLSFLDYVDQRVFPGGCFFASAAAEMGARPGAVRDHLARQQRDWMSLLESLALQASELGELADATDPAQLAFELNALVVAANTAFVLHEDHTAIERSRRAIDHRLDAV